MQKLPLPASRIKGQLLSNPVSPSMEVLLAEMHDKPTFQVALKSF